MSSANGKPSKRDSWRDMLRPFATVVYRRLVNGSAVYGDRSLSAAPGELLRELSEEASDLAAWGYLLWRRCERMRRELETSTTCPLCGAQTSPLEGVCDEDVTI